MCHLAAKNGHMQGTTDLGSESEKMEALEVKSSLDVKANTSIGVILHLYSTEMSVFEGDIV